MQRQRSGLPELIAASRAMEPVLRLVERVAPSEASVLITGEHGTGKDVVARWLHAASARSTRAFVPVNAGGLSEGVFESELFGHVKGAFTDAKADRVGSFEVADGGTLFLDEIANLPLSKQPKLLRVLQTGELQRVGSSRARRVDVRVLAATNADIAREITEDRFREDLLYRLNTVEIHLPPLRERREDIGPLASHFLQHLAERQRKPGWALEPAAMRTLLEHDWPGNVRELEHTMERATLLAPRDTISTADLNLRPRGGAEAVPRFEELTLEEAERRLIQKALARFDGNVSRAAEALGVSRSALYRRLQSHGL